jgi:hypothetical protein
MLRNAALAVCAAVGAFGCTAVASAQVPRLIVNGQTVTFEQPPVEQAGRVLVPLRGVFERLGASVVYQNGLINATGNGRNVSLHIGSTQATVNGRSQTIDVPPYVIAGRTLVPLRFVAQALGASVNWNPSDNTVRIDGGGNSNAGTSPRMNNRGNYLRGIVPTDGSSVRGSFALSGRTLPNSTVTVTARTTRGLLGQIFGGSGSNVDRTTVMANRNGTFSVPLRTGSLARGGSLELTIRSRSPAGATAVQTVTYSI